MKKNKGIHLGAVLAAMLLVSMALVSVASAVPIFGVGTVFPVEVDTDNAVVGDVIAKGIHNLDGSCELGSLKVRTIAPDDDTTQRIGIKLDTLCQVVVNAKWRGSLRDGPIEVVEPIIAVMPNMTLQVQEEELPNSENKYDATVLGVTSGSKTSEQHVFMYGYGGALDKLTHKTGKIFFSYNGNSATINSQSGGCSGSGHGWWEWIVDRCVLNSVNNGPSSVVWRTGQGDYHCSPTDTFPCSVSNPDGYYHSLYDQEDGHADGTSHCTYWYAGTIVLNVSREVLQGCS